MQEFQRIILPPVQQGRGFYWRRPEQVMLALKRLDQLLHMCPRHPRMQKIKVHHPVQTSTGQTQLVAKGQKAPMQDFSHRWRFKPHAKHIFQMRVDAQVIAAVTVIKRMGHRPPRQVSMRMEQFRNCLRPAPQKGAHPRNGILSQFVAQGQQTKERGGFGTFELPIKKKVGDSAGHKISSKKFTYIISLRRIFLTSRNDLPPYSSPSESTAS
ncbi:hypothetical protein [Phaeovulum sp. NW3]|uniref:hypothetical protein n=1 Tax=Phaeovulum sp. NW3 TaxID=2934933 RepID=UPI0020202A35|nr:hypothetical protein [Phaeovulum sp. NW3]MCL7466660.1 hypothetical protein [Phaeovulum sp. NW3]